MGQESEAKGTETVVDDETLLERRIEQQLRDADIDLVVSVRPHMVILRGSVRTPLERAFAREVVERLTGQRRIIDEIAVHRTEPGPTQPTPPRIEVYGVEPEVLDRYVTDVTESHDEALPFFPPTDPVVAPVERGLEIRGGFSATSMDVLEDETAPEPAVESPVRGDEEIAEDVRRELREDAMTAFLEIEVTVEDGVVTLQGMVPALEDADAAEEVASRVPGVVEVRDLLVVREL